MLKCVKFSRSRSELKFVDFIFCKLIQQFDSMFLLILKLFQQYFYSVYYVLSGAVIVLFTMRRNYKLCNRIEVELRFKRENKTQLCCYLLVFVCYFLLSLLTSFYSCYCCCCSHSIAFCSRYVFLFSHSLSRSLAFF